VHCETTTGALAPLAELCRVAAARRVATVVDAVGSAGAHPLGLGPGGPDWVALTSGKAVEGRPGLSFVVGRGALDAAPRTGGYYLDLRRNLAAQRAGRVAHTVSPALVAAAHQALLRWERETPAGREARYAATADALRTGLVARGFALVPLPAGQRSNVVVPVRLPAAVDFAAVQGRLLELGMEVYRAPETLARGYFFLAALGRVDDADLAAFLDALAVGCGLGPSGPGRRP
jgi:2-aminoethylphosphonate-pyruvate transaminase